MPNTLFIGKVYLCFDELSSTNDYAAELIAEGGKTNAKSTPPEGMVVRAASQSAGRGQFGSRWEGEAGNSLTLSVILYPVWLDVSAQFYLSMAVALGVFDAIDRILQHVSTVPIEAFPHNTGALVANIKWPNDLYIADKKIAGILIQNSISGKNIQSSIVGIGLNVNQLEFHSDVPNPGSLALAAGHSFDLDSVAETLFECLEQRYLQLKARCFEEIRHEYESHLYRLGEAAQYMRAGTGEIFNGVVRGVTEEGRLRIQTASGEETFEVKEIKWLR